MAREVLRRWVIFLGALGLSLLPGLLGLTVSPWLAEFPRFLNAAVIWLIMAMSPGGFARTEFDGVIWLGDSAWLVSLGVWGVAGLAYARVLARIRIRIFLALLLPLIFATAFSAHLLLRLFGITAYVGV